jgi:hypothetical protein
MSAAVASLLGRFMDFLAGEYSQVVDDEDASPRYTWILPL